MFARCMASIAAQKGNVEINIIVSYDDDNTKDYVLKYDIITAVKVVKRVFNKPPHFYTAPWNLYLNDMILLAKPGWVLILDDDDVLAHERVLRELAINLKDTRSLVLTRMEWPNGRIIPGEDYFGKEPVRKHIGMPCFCWHTDYNNLVKFDGLRAGDYRVVAMLYKKIPKHILISRPIVRTGNTGLVGASEK